MPPHWVNFLAAHNLIGREVSISESADRSGVGVDMEFLNEADSLSELQDAYPGLAVVADGFVPVGSCLIGSGDPYFINLADGEGGPLYRIYHDSVSEHGYDRSTAVAVVLEDYRELLQYLTI